MSASAKRVFKDVVCPFCSLLCDDLVVERHGSSVRPVRNHCPRAARGFRDARSGVRAHIGGRAVDSASAVSRAGALLQRAVQPLIYGIDADVDGCRAAVALAESCGAVIDHPGARAARGNTRVLQTEGWVMTTLTEMRNRADCVVFVGTDASSHPRFFERIIWPRHTLFGKKKNPRHINYLGEKLGTRPGTGPDGVRPTVITCGGADIARQVSVLRAFVRGSEIEPGVLTPNRIRGLRQLSDRLKAATYGVLVWAPADLPPRDADSIIQCIRDIVVTLNGSTRAAGLSVGGNDGASTFGAVCTWQSGYPPPVDFSGGAPKHDGMRMDGERLLSQGSVDALLWINASTPGAVPPRGARHTIAVGRPDPELARMVDVYIPVGVPGIDHSGVLFRLDSVVSLPVRMLRPPRHDSAAAIIDAIREAL